MSQAPKNPVTRSQKAGEADPSSGAPAAPATASAVPAPSAGEPTATTSKSKDTNPGEPAHSAKAPSKSNAPKEPKSKTAKSAVINVDASPAQKSSLTDTIPPALLSALGSDYIKSLGSKSVESLNKPIAVKNPLAGNGPAPELHPPSGASEECKMIGIKAIEAELAGETATANALFNLYKAMSTPKANAHLANPVNCQGLIGTPMPAPSNEGGLNFVSGAITTHLDVGFTPFFDKNIRELRAPIPLTIFNKEWQDKAITHHVEKRSKSDENSADKGTRYSGYPYPNEFTQSFSTWTVNHRNFYTTLKDVYNFATFSDWVLRHKANVDLIQSRDGFMPAFRYDIQVRSNAFSHRVSVGGVESIPDISVLQEDIAAICYAQCRKFDELGFTDNPYAKDGPRATWDPLTGAPTAGRPGAKSYSAGPNPGSGGGGGREHHERKSGYKGSNFDPNYVDKRAGNSSNQDRGASNNNGTKAPTTRRAAKVQSLV
ncbi:hypothetical protein PTTG_09226 [Puccinia triticina 1-1 BBBD Race 1]|uniref:Uncharacterized protein n=1 Tax=Puccinia triticina (isolate 1-1 / race 1 (BBBD)) TaxID=630390 RepID=A0A180GYA9_PUCT1|nr:hypothetical protein PTTG_09226 [Puccinia triticina 1-1 BBBD Race 1]